LKVTHAVAPAKFVRPLAVVLLLAGSLCAQEKEFAPPPVTPESQFLELIDLEGDAEKQLLLMDLFVKQFPKYNAMGAVYSEMQANCVKLGLFDRALDLGDKLLVIDQDDAEAVKLNLEAAQGKKDEALIKKWSDRLAQLSQNEPNGNVSASSTIALPFTEGTGAAGEAPGKGPGTVSRQVKLRMEAGLFNKAIQETNPTVRLEVLNQFAKQFPQSQHMSKVTYLYYLAYREMGDKTKALGLAEQILAKDQTREDVLYFVAETYFGQKRELGKVLSYSAMILDLVNGKPKPEGMSDADWAKQRETLTQQSHYMSGMSHVYQERFGAADKELRLALASGRMSDQMRASILTSLAWSNYKNKNIPDAIHFYQLCAEIPGPLQTAAGQSVTSIKNEYGMVQ
jgi:tetratricopeptide (TPR) repeat protein